MVCGLSKSNLILILSFAFVCCCLFNSFADNSSDTAEIANDTSADVVVVPAAKSEQKPFMKFRGSVSFAGYYFFGSQTGQRVGNISHISRDTYEVADYTEAGDPLGQHHNDGKGREVGTSWGGLKGGLFVRYSAIAPFLTADHFLFRDNNIKVTLKGDLTPVSLAQGISVTITPIAFLKFEGGCNIGSGWDFFGIFNGLGINDGTCVKGRRQNFYGPVFHSYFSLTFQFDVAALMPAKYKRWTHIVMQAQPVVKFRCLLNVGSDVSWQYNADRGENFNGWVMEGSYLIGYQIPIIVDDCGQDRMFLKRRNNRFTISPAMFFEIDKWNLSNMLRSTMASGGWGSDFCYVYFGPVVMFDLPNNMNVIFGCEWANDIEYTEQTVGNLFFQNRVYKDWYVNFSRLLLSVGWDF